jgi:hypothetical protein
MGELCRIIRHLGSGNQIDATMTFARADFVNMINRFHCEDHQQHVPLFWRPPRNISAIIDTSTSVATAESVRFIASAFNHIIITPITPSSGAMGFRCSRAQL